MKIGIDCRLAGRQHAGIGRYIENLIVRLPALAPDVTFVYFFHDQRQAADINIEAPNVVRRFIPIRHYSLTEQTRLPGIFTQEKLDLLHVPHFNAPLLYKGKIILTIHDLLWHEFRGTRVTTLPSWLYFLKYFAYKKIVGQMIARAEKIFVPAQTIAQTVSRYYPQAKAKIVVTKEGISSTFLGKRISQPHKLKQFIYVGSLYPHKNIRLVIDALLKLSQYRLLIVGTRNVFQDDVKAYVRLKGLERQVEFLGYKSDSEIKELLEKSTALVQPSFSEGFGLTGVEAMATGTPVLASDIPIFEEIYQDGALYFDPHSVYSFCASVKRLESLDTEQLIQKSKKIVTQYSWDEMTQKTLDTYRSCLQK